MGAVNPKSTQKELQDYLRRISSTMIGRDGRRNEILMQMRPELLPREMRYGMAVGDALAKLGQDPRRAARLGHTIARPFANINDFMYSFPDAVNDVIGLKAKHERLGVPATGEDYATALAFAGLSSLDALPSKIATVPAKRVMNKAVPYFFEETPVVQKRVIRSKSPFAVGGKVSKLKAPKARFKAKGI